MKKKTVIILCAVLAFLIAAGAVAYVFLPHPLNYPIDSIEAVGSSLCVLERTDDSVKVCKKGDGEFKVLMFTDMHLDGKNETSYTTISWLVKNIQAEKPDLVILGGDNVTSALNRKRAKQLGEIFEKLGVYWAGVLGNHEGDNLFSISRETMMDIFCSYDHCLMRKGLSDVDGCCNYALEITDESGKKLLKTFFFLDTFDMVADKDKADYGFSKEEKVTDGAHENQVEWYKRKAAAIREEFGDYTSIAVMHIPLPQMENAKTPYLYGVNNESDDGKDGVCSSNIERGMFAALKEAGGTEAVFFGHDHLNNFGVEMDGILLSYIEASGYGSYNMGSRGHEETEWMQGCTRLVLHEGGGFTLTEIKNNAALTGEAPVTYER